MSDALAGRAEQLRARFDRRFAEPPRSAAEAPVHLLAIRAGNAALALRVSEIASVHTDKVIRAVPSPLLTLRGVAGLRGDLLPVHDLAALLGEPPDPAARWLAVLAGKERLAVTFAALDQHLRVAPSAVIGDGGERRGRHIAGAVLTTDGPRAVVDLGSILLALQQHIRSST